MHLWDPELSPKNNHLLMIRDAVKRNSLSLLFEESQEHFFATDQFTVAAEERWDSALQMDLGVQAFDREKIRPSGKKLRKLSSSNACVSAP